MRTLAINEDSYLILAWCSCLCRVPCLLHWRKTPILRRRSDSPTGAMNGRQIIRQPSYDSTKNLNYGCYIFTQICREGAIMSPHQSTSAVRLTLAISVNPTRISASIGSRNATRCGRSSTNAPTPMRSLQASRACRTSSRGRQAGSRIFTTRRSRCRLFLCHSPCKSAGFQQSASIPKAHGREHWTSPWIVCI
jgi:hypothetical protein